MVLIRVPFILSIYERLSHCFCNSLAMTDSDRQRYKKVLETHAVCGYAYGQVNKTPMFQLFYICKSYFNESIAKSILIPTEELIDLISLVIHNTDSISNYNMDVLTLLSCVQFRE